MRRALLAVVAVAAVLAASLLPAQSAPLVAADVVPTCVKPSSNITHLKMVTYEQCLQQRTEALLANAHGPAPTVTETVTTTPAPAPTVTETVTVTATPTPSPTPTPEPTPAPAGYPNASNTGVPAGATLATVDGNVTLSTAGQVYADRQVNGCIEVNAANVTIRRVKVICNGLAAIYNNSTGLVVEDTEVSCGSDGVGRTGIAPINYTLRRVNAYGCENITWSRVNVLIVDSYIHDPVNYDPVRDPHTDSIQIPSGSTNIVIRHNTILGGYVDQSDFGNAAITMGGNVSGIVVDNNVLAGGGYTLYCEQENLGGDGSPQPQYTNNRFSTMYRSAVGGFGPASDCADELWTGNVYHETNQPLTLG